MTIDNITVIKLNIDFIHCVVVNQFYPHLSFSRAICIANAADVITSQSFS